VDMSASQTPRRKTSRRRAIKQRLPERKADRPLSEQRGGEPNRERDERLAAETDVERATAPRARKGPTLCGD